MSKRKTTVNPKTQQMALTAILATIAIVMAFTPIGYFGITGLFEIALILLPVAIGAVVLDWKAGLIMGAIFGITSFMIAAGIGMHLNTLGTFMFQQNAFFTAIVCIVPRLICGVVPAFIYKLISKKDKKGFIAIPTACVSTAVLNTVLFLGAIWIFFGNPIQSEAAYGGFIVDKYGNFNFFTYFIAFAALNAPIEIAACGVLGTAIAKPLLILKEKMS